MRSQDGQGRRDEQGVARAQDVRRVTVLGLLANLGLAGLKFIVGVLSASQALVADAAHSLSDTFTDVAILIGVRYWSAPADEMHPHGHGRIEALISLLIGFSLAGVGAGLAYRAIATLHERHAASPGWTAFGVACLSIVVKEALCRWTVFVARRVRSSALIANAWHHRSDALSSLPVALAVLGTHLWPSLVFLDHIATVVVSGLVVQAAWRIAWPALRELTDTGASVEDRDAILALTRGVPGVRTVHALRTRRIGAGLQVDLHVQVAPELTVWEGHEIAKAVKDRLIGEGPALLDVLVHVEPYEADTGARPEAPA